MARQSGNSLFGSLRGKIWISTSVLAFFICTFGLISYLVVSLLINDPFYGLFIPFLLLAFTVMFFGWWLANEVVNPVENVTLLAKSLERSSSTSIPRSSGSTETDQLLQTIQRNNQQMQKIITLMDKVANGNLDVAPMQGSDRLSTTFQKLLVKVSESIHAKEELDELKSAVNDLKMDISSVRSGNLDVTIRSQYAHTRELSDTFKYLIENMSGLIAAVRDGAEDAEQSVKRVDEEMQSLIQRDEGRVQDMAQASIALKQVPNLINKITEDLMGSAKSARLSIEKARHGTQIANQNSSSVSNLRKQVREDVKRIQNLTERSHDIEKVAKTVEDLASRTNMIALNASIQATEMGEEGHGFVLVAEEVERLAARANGTNKQISTLNKSILAEINKVENSVETTMSEVASLSKFAIETGNVLGEMERYVAHFLNLQENLIAYSKDQSEETDEAFKTFADSIAETESTISKLKDSSSELSAVAKLVRDLNLSVGEFRLAEVSAPINVKNPDNLEPDAFDGDHVSDRFENEAEDKNFNTESFDAVRTDTTEFNQMNETEAASEDSSGEENDSYKPETNDADDAANFHPDPNDDGFDSLEPDEYPHQAESEPADSIADMEKEMETDENFAFAQNQPDDEFDFDEESEDNGVFELYQASMSRETDSAEFHSEESVSGDLMEESAEFDSDEFTSDELIEETDPSEEKEVKQHNAPETMVIEADEPDDLLGVGLYDNSAADNELAVLSE